MYSKALNNTLNKIIIIINFLKFNKFNINFFKINFTKLKIN